MTQDAASRAAELTAPQLRMKLAAMMKSHRERSHIRWDFGGYTAAMHQEFANELAELLGVPKEYRK